MLEQLTNRNIPVNYSTRSVNVKQKIVQGRGPSNINCSSFVINFEVRRLLKPVPSTNYDCSNDVIQKRKMEKANYALRMLNAPYIAIEQDICCTNSIF